MTTAEAQRQLAAPPAPNPMGADRMQITESRLVQGFDTTKPPVMTVVYRGPWERF